jgi:hypothetical protein
MRVGVTASELTGKRWKCLQASVQITRTSSNIGLNLLRQHRSTISLVLAQSLKLIIIRINLFTYYDCN